MRNKTSYTLHILLTFISDKQNDRHIFILCFYTYILPNGRQDNARMKIKKQEKYAQIQWEV